MAKTIFTKTKNGCTFVGTEYTPQEQKIIERKKTKEKIYKWLGFYLLAELFVCFLGAIALYGSIYCITKIIRMAWNG